MDLEEAGRAIREAVEAERAGTTVYIRVTDGTEVVLMRVGRAWRMLSPHGAKGQYTDGSRVRVSVTKRTPYHSGELTIDVGYPGGAASEGGMRSHGRTALGEDDVESVEVLT